MMHYIRGMVIFSLNIPIKSDRFVSALMMHLSNNYNVNWHNIERHHGKGPMDGLEGTVKNKDFRHVKSHKIKTVDAKGFAEYADKIVYVRG